MAFNIIDLVKEQLTPGNIGAIAGLLGEDQKKPHPAFPVRCRRCWEA
jgi:hypothetical protein